MFHSHGCMVPRSNDENKKRNEKKRKKKVKNGRLDHMGGMPAPASAKFFFAHVEWDGLLE